MSDREMTSLMNVVLLIERGLDEAMAKRIVAQWEDKCEELASAKAQVTIARNSNGFELLDRCSQGGKTDDTDNIDWDTLAEERLGQRPRSEHGRHIPQTSPAPGDDSGRHSPPEHEAVRQRAAEAIRTFCKSLGVDAVVISTRDGIERIYYSGVPLNALADAVAVALSREEQR